MAAIREFEHKGVTFTVTVIRIGAHFLATFHIPGMYTRPATTHLETDSYEGAFRLAQQRAEHLIETPPVRLGVPA